MPIDRPAVTYWHERGTRDGTSFRSSFGPDETVSTGRFFVDWTERHNAVMSLLGYSQLEGDIDNPTRLMRLTPAKHPDIATAVGGAGHLYATRVPSVTGHKPGTHRTDLLWPGGKFNTFEQAELEVEFSQVPYAVLEDAELSDSFAEWERFTSIESFAPSADYLMLPGGTMVYLRDSGTGTPHNRAIPFNVGVILPIIELKLKWWAVPFDVCAPLTDGPWKARVFGDGTEGSVPYLGTVNKTDFLGYPAGTLLFSAVDLERRRMPYTGLAWDITFTLAYDPHKWNFKLFVSTDSASAAATGWYFVAKRGASYQAPGSLTDYTSIYNEREHRELWKVAA